MTCNTAHIISRISDTDSFAMFNVCRPCNAKAWSLEITQLRTAALPIYAYFIKYVSIDSSQWHFKNYYFAQSITYSELLCGKSDHSEQHTHAHTTSLLVIRLRVCIYIYDNCRVSAMCQGRNFVTVSFETQNNPLTDLLLILYLLCCIVSVME